MSRPGSRPPGVPPGACQAGGGGRLTLFQELTRPVPESVHKQTNEQKTRPRLFKGFYYPSDADADAAIAGPRTARAARAHRDGHSRVAASRSVWACPRAFRAAGAWLSRPDGPSPAVLCRGTRCSGSRAALQPPRLRRPRGGPRSPGAARPGADTPGLGTRGGVCRGVCRERRNGRSRGKRPAKGGD